MFNDFFKFLVIKFAVPGWRFVGLLQFADAVCFTLWFALTGAGDIGFKVGTATGGAQLVAAAPDQILDGGTTVPAAAGYNLTLLNIYILPL